MLPLQALRNADYSFFDITSTYMLNWSSSTDYDLIYRLNTTVKSYTNGEYLIDWITYVK